jgi:hypothetical protein
MRRISMTGVALLTCAALLSLVRVSAYQKADPQAFNGTWKLDAGASSNPNGPANPGPVRAPRPTGGAKGGSGMQAGGGGGEGASGGSDAALGGAEQKRFYAMMKLLTHAPSTLAIAGTTTDVTLTQDASKPFHHMTNGKTEKLPIGENLGDLEIKTKWDGAALKREIKTIDGLTVAETYTLAGDGKQLLVAIELKSQIERLADDVKQPIKRVYTRAQ